MVEASERVKEDKVAIFENSRAVAQKFREMKLSEAAQKLKTLPKKRFATWISPERQKIRSNNVIERLKRETRRCTRVVDIPRQ